MKQRTTRMTSKQLDTARQRSESQTNWDTVAKTEPALNANEELTREAFLQVLPDSPGKQMISIRLDKDVLNWLKKTSRGKGYQSRINRVLRAYMEANSKKAA